MTGRDWQEFAKEFVPKFRTKDGGVWRPDWTSVRDLLPRNYSVGPPG